MIKKVLKGILIFMAIILLGLIGLYLIPPKQEKVQYNYAEVEKDDNISSKVGWYLTNDGREYQITWGAKRGLQLNHFDSLRSNLKQIRLTPLSYSQFDTDGDLETAEVNFRTSDSLFALEVATSKTNFLANKRDSLHYSQEEITYTQNGVKLAGLLMTPINNEKATAIILVHGSGVSDRDNFWYMYQANYLARNGFMVLLPDKRGCGKSSGEWHTASFDDFANDIVGAQAYLEKNKSAEFNRIGVMGLSQGGWIIHLANEKINNLDFVISAVGATTSPNKQVHFEIMNDIIESGAPGFIAKPLALVFAKRVKAKRKIWWEKNGNFDPIPLIRESKIPILKIFAANDKNVPVVESIRLIENMMLDHPETPVTLKTFNGSGHTLFGTETGWIRNDYLDYIIDWIN